MNIASIDEQVDALMEEQEEAKKDPSDVYTHKFSRPLVYNGEEYAELTFDLASLTGEDDVAAQAELRSRGITAVLPAVLPEYLAIMAARACTYRRDGKRVISQFALRSAPIRDFNAISGKVRRFLLSMG